MLELSGSPASHTNASRRFWDENHAVSEDPLFWMANPTCRAAINRRVTGDPNVWPLDGFARDMAGRTFRRALSLGCGMGSLERAARRSGLCERITGIDFSATTLEIARERAEQEGLSGISYELGDLNSVVLPHDAFDLVLIHQSLHHVIGLEKLLGRVARCLTRDGILFGDEWTGPSRDEWSPNMLDRLRSIYAGLPAGWRRTAELPLPIVHDDPSEAVRSSAIRATLRLFFDVVERPYGGHVTAVLLSQLTPEAARDPRFPEHVAQWLELEDEDIRMHPERSYHTAFTGRPHRGPRLATAFARAAGRRVRLRAHYHADAFLRSRDEALTGRTRSA